VQPVENHAGEVANLVSARAEEQMTASRRLPIKAGPEAGGIAGPTGGPVARVLDMSEGGTEGMRPVQRSPQQTKESASSLEVDEAAIEVDEAALEIEAVPAECPGVFIEQPLERWSPRDLATGVSRLARWTRLATS
jgi:hypothetical protein